MGDERDESGAFKITDRRKFTSEGEARPESEGESAPEGSAGGWEPAAEIAGEPGEVQADSPEAVNFSSFVLSLATTGMVHLGEIPEPSTGQKMENAEAAGQMIELLSILQKKTKGNLSEEEATLLEGVLYELRMKFVNRTK